MNWSIKIDDEIVAAFDQTIVDAYGPRYARLMTGSVMRKDIPIADNWREMGATTEMCASVFAEGLARMKEGCKPPPFSLAYFDVPVKAAIMAAEEAKRVVLSPEESRWKMRLTWFKERGKWDENMWGPRPGEHLCRVPPRIRTMVGV